MNQPLPDTATLTGLGHEITTSWYSNIPRDERTFVLWTIAEMLVHECLIAVQEERRPSFVDLAERICLRPGRARALSILLQDRESLHRSIVEHGVSDHYLKDLELVQEPVLAHADAESKATHFPFNVYSDEIDSAIDKLLVRLATVDDGEVEHSRAVSEWCERLARRMGFSPSETLFLKRAGLLHDIGRLETPAAARPADHVLAGERIVLGRSVLASFGPITRSHHEALDGSGYPDHLCADQISMAARILAVADAFNDALRGGPGRPPLTSCDAVAELTTKCGSLYDVTVVAALHDLVQRR